MPRKFAFTANEEVGELQLGGYEPASTTGPMDMFPMAGFAYGVNVTSIKFGGTELLNFQPSHESYVGEFDSGTTCLLLPNSTVNGTFKTNPFQLLLDKQNSGQAFPLVYTIGGKQYEIAYEECVEPAERAMILGDPWFRKWIVLHDLTDLKHKKMGLALRNPDYVLGVETDVSATLGDNHAIESAKAREAELADFKPLSKVRANRRVRPMKLAMTQAKYNGEAVDKVALSSQSRVTYNVKLSIGSPPQPLQVIFDTGSFMLAVFADPAPKGMKPILEAASGVYEGTMSFADRAKELAWSVEGVNRGALIAANVLFGGLFIMGVVSLTQRRRKAASYHELRDHCESTC